MKLRAILTPSLSKLLIGFQLSIVYRLGLTFLSLNRVSSTRNNESYKVYEILRFYETLSLNVCKAIVLGKCENFY